MPVIVPPVIATLLASWFAIVPIGPPFRVPAVIAAALAFWTAIVPNATPPVLVQVITPGTEIVQSPDIATEVSEPPNVSPQSARAPTVLVVGPTTPHGNVRMTPLT